MDLKVIRSQHYELRKTIQELKDILWENQIERDLLIISMKVGTLSGILSMHLRYEDDHIYPDLINHSSDEVVKTVNDYKTTMGDLSLRFDHYMEKYYKNPLAMKNNSKDFIEETRQILTAIQTRIEREEYGLFPLIR